LLLLEQVPTPAAIEAEWARRDFRRFVAAAWPIIEPATPFQGGYHVDAICEHLTAITRGDLHNLIINIPPRHTKSSLVAVLWPVWEWLDQPSLRAVFASYGLALSIRDSLKRRRLIESPWYQAHYGARYQLTSDQNAKTRYENDRTGVHLATSVGGIGTGEGGERIIVDDPHNAEEIESDAIRQGVLDWWDGAMATRGNQPHAVARVIVMQRLHEADLVGHLLDKMQDGGTQYDHLILPAEYEPRVQVCLAGLDHDPRTEPGALLSPDRFDAAAMATMTADLGAQRAAGQLQQRPAPAGGGIFKRDWWAEGRNRYDATDEHRRIHCVARWLSFDTAMKDAESNDYTARVVFELQPDYRLAVRDVLLERLEFPALISTIEAEATRWNDDGKLEGIIIEDKGSGTSAGQSLKAAAPRWVADLLRMFVPQGSKEYRARQVSVWCAKGCILLPQIDATVPWLHGFAGPDGRLWKFPAVAHDDDIDAFDQGIIYLEHYVAEGYQARGGTASVTEAA
jgi:predicted phage terminase large subunit-like protein